MAYGYYSSGMLSGTPVYAGETTPSFVNPYPQSPILPPAPKQQATPPAFIANDPLFQTSPAMQRAEQAGWTFVRNNPRATDVLGSGLFDLSNYYIDPATREIINILRGKEGEDYTIVENPETSTIDVVDARGRVVGSSTPTLVPLPQTSGGAAAPAPAPAPATTPAYTEIPESYGSVGGGYAYPNERITKEGATVSDTITNPDGSTVVVYSDGSSKWGKAPTEIPPQPPTDTEPTEDFADITTYGVDLRNIFDRQPELPLPEVVTTPEPTPAPVATPEPTPEPVATPEPTPTPSEDIGTGNGGTGLGGIGLGLAGMLTGFGALARQPSVTDTLTTPAMDRFRITAELLPTVEPIYRRV